MQKYDKQQPVTTFRPMSIVAKRSPISATAELLFMYALASRMCQYHKFQDTSLSHERLEIFELNLPRRRRTLFNTISHARYHFR